MIAFIVSYRLFWEDCRDEIIRFIWGLKGILAGFRLLAFLALAISLSNFLFYSLSSSLYSIIYYYFSTLILFLMTIYNSSRSPFPIGYILIFSTILINFLKVSYTPGLIHFSACLNSSWSPSFQPIKLPGYKQYCLINLTRPSMVFLRTSLSKLLYWYRCLNKNKGTFCERLFIGFYHDRNRELWRLMRQFFRPIGMRIITRWLFY